MNLCTVHPLHIFDNLMFILTKSHLGSYPCPLNINFYWNMGFTLGIVIVVQIVTGLFLSFHYSSDINEAYFSVFFLIREIYYGWSLRFLHSSGASFVFLFVFLILQHKDSVSSLKGCALVYEASGIRFQNYTPTVSRISS